MRKTEYAHVSVFGKQAENCRDSLMKGSQVCVEGNVKANAYLDNEGKPKAGLNITAKEVMFLNRTKSREKS